jgi:hypothetical protein
VRRAVLVGIALALGSGCGFSYPAADLTLARTLYARSQDMAHRHLYSIALGDLAALASPQLRGFAVPGSSALEAAIRAQVCDREAARRQDTDSLIVDVNEYYVWPFDGDYWPDELGSYRVLASSSCSIKDRGPPTPRPRSTPLSSRSAPGP